VANQEKPKPSARHDTAGSALPLSGRHALVTGGGRGIGVAIASTLLALGADVTIVGRDKGVLLNATGRLAARAAGRIAAESCDVTSLDSIAAALTAATQRLGDVHILVNNAGAVRSAPFEKTDLAAWNDALAVNLTGAYLCTQIVMPGMRAAGWGRIINVASTAGLKGYRYVAAYCAAKHGLVGLTRALAVELARAGITVNAVCPGYTDTEMVRDAAGKIAAKTGRSVEQARAELASANPQGRLITPEEVAHAVGWLCLPPSAGITGQALPIDGGETVA